MTEPNELEIETELARMRRNQATRILCASCGFATDEHHLPALASTVQGHMERCPERFYGDAIFGFVPRWRKYHDGRGDVVIELAWTTSAWGMPLNLPAIA